METFVKPTWAAGAKTLAASWYVSPEIFAQEQERIFAREWIVRRPRGVHSRRPATSSP